MLSTTLEYSYNKFSDSYWICYILVSNFSSFEFIDDILSVFPDDNDLAAAKLAFVNFRKSVTVCRNLLKLQIEKERPETMVNNKKAK